MSQQKWLKCLVNYCLLQDFINICTLYFLSDFACGNSVKVPLQFSDAYYTIFYILQACIDGNLDVVQYLVEHGIDIDQEDNEGWTPLHAAASCGYMEIARWKS